MTTFENWSLRLLEQTLLTSGYKIVITTNRPCHLWLRWTDVIPQKHITPLYKRGIYLFCDGRYCFVSYQDIEQQEAGDTTTHTFYWQDWYYCLSRWFYFHGNIAGKPSTSVSPIFQKHFPGVPLGPPVSVNFNPLDQDGFSLAQWNQPADTYHLNWWAAYAPTSDNVFEAQIYNDDHDWNPVITRVFLVFDTTLLPPQAVVVEAQVRLNPRDITDPRHTSLCLTPATLIHDPLIESDYSSLRKTPTVLGSYPLAQMIHETPFFMDIQSHGFPFITPAANTYFGLRLAGEIIESPSTGSSEHLRISLSKHWDPGWRPWLYITYRTPA